MDVLLSCLPFLKLHMYFPLHIISINLFMWLRNVVQSIRLLMRAELAHDLMYFRTEHLLEGTGYIVI